MQIFIKDVCRTLIIDAESTSTVATLKRIIELEHGIPAGVQSLTLGSKHLSDGFELAHYNIVRESTLCLVLPLPGGRGPSPEAMHDCARENGLLNERQFTMRRLESLRSGRAQAAERYNSSIDALAALKTTILNLCTDLAQDEWQQPQAERQRQLSTQRVEGRNQPLSGNIRQRQPLNQEVIDGSSRLHVARNHIDSQKANAVRLQEQIETMRASLWDYDNHISEIQDQIEELDSQLRSLTRH